MPPKRALSIFKYTYITTNIFLTKQIVHKIFHTKVCANFCICMNPKNMCKVLDYLSDKKSEIKFSEEIFLDISPE